MGVYIYLYIYTHIFHFFFFRAWRQVPAWPPGRLPPCPPSNVKASPPQPIWRSTKKDVLTTWDDFLGSKGFVLSSLTEVDPKWGPNCPDAPVQGTRTRLVNEHHPHNWDPVLACLGPEGVKNMVFCAC